MAKLPVELTEKEKRSCNAAIGALRGFGWFKTPQGSNYWHEVMMNLERCSSYSCRPYDDDLGMAGEFLAPQLNAGAVLGNGAHDHVVFDDQEDDHGN